MTREDGLSRQNLGANGVVNSGFCIGCGACTAISAGAQVGFNDFGELTARFNAISSEESAKMDRVCPFSSTVPSESELAEFAFGKVENIRLGSEVGFFDGLYAAYSNEHRALGSSGGIVTWLLGKLLTTGIVDKVIVVGRSSGDERFYDFKVVDNLADLSNAATSFYYPVSYDRVLKYILDNPGRYAITGVPCFQKALRLLKRENAVLKERVVIQVGIVCGQMKSAFYMEYLARRAGLPGKVEQACFRRKNPSARADEYDFEAKSILPDGEQAIRRIGNRDIGSNWGMGLFKPKACDYCDDVFAETADVAVMDAWLPKYVSDGRGTSLVVVRSAVIQSIFDAEVASSSELWIEQVSEDEVMESQRGGLNHRRAGLRYRLAVIPNEDVTPVKRVRAHTNFGRLFKLEQQLRQKLRIASRDAMRIQLESGAPGLSIYDNRMRFLLSMYRWFNRIKGRIISPIDYRNEFKLDA